jgi:hypothetical protein
MELSPEDIMARMETYAACAHRIKEIKDLLLDFEIYGDEDLVTASMHHQDELVMEIRTIYQQRMAPLVEEIACYVSEHMNLLRAPSEGERARAQEQELLLEEAPDPETDSREKALDMGNSLLSSIMEQQGTPL